uniref:Uncharacterized protein n=1 Tax=Globodera rostochiensis TaxID=31243 RepID=A0A914H9C0_GLORO
MTETNSSQIAPEQASSSTSLNNAVRELQVIRARILELEDQKQTTNSTTRNMVEQELEEGELSDSSVSTWSGTSDDSPISPPHRRVRFASPPPNPLPIPPPALVVPQRHRTLVEPSRRRPDFRQPFRPVHRMSTVRIISPTQNRPPFRFPPTPVHRMATVRIISPTQDRPPFRLPFNTAQQRIVLPTLNRPQFRLPTPQSTFTHPPPRTVPPPPLTSPTFPFPPPVLNQYNITQTNATNYFR